MATVPKPLVLPREPAYKYGRDLTSATVITNRMREVIQNTVCENMTGIVTALVLAAQAEKPDVNAAKLLWEYAGLKPTDKVEVSGGLGILQIIKQLEDGNKQA